MTKEREALKLALDAIENISVKSVNGLDGLDMERLAGAATALREALAQPKAEAHLQAVSDFGQLQAQLDERNFCPRCGKRLMSALGPVSLHTCCPPNGRTFDDYGNKIV